MTMQRTIGGDRLGSGKKMTVDLKTYERSTHDLGYLWRNTQAPGTLVPFLVKLGLPGDTFDIDLESDIMTHPTLGPLFGSFKAQYDVFMCPIRLYQAQLHNNALKIGLDMAKVKLPQITMQAHNPAYYATEDIPDLDNSQINPSSIFKYLGISGIGVAPNNSRTVIRQFNAIPWIAYWDIVKNYYSNKQENIGAVIHHEISATIGANIDHIETWEGTTRGENIHSYEDWTGVTDNVNVSGNTRLRIITTGSPTGLEKIKNVILNVIVNGVPTIQTADYFYSGFVQSGNQWELTSPKINMNGQQIAWYRNVPLPEPITVSPKVTTFPLDNLDEMRNDILASIKETDAFVIDKETYAPYGLALQEAMTEDELVYSKLFSQEGLALKTYQSDLFNNWIDTEFIDGDNGINAITAIDTSEGSFTIDTLTLSRKVYDMLNRIAISGGTYKDWVETIWTHNGHWMAETPVYQGGMMREVVFQEVISNSASETQDGIQPLGELGGRGVLSNRKKGGRITVKVDEPCYVIGIVSLTPRIDYSQGNDADVNLKTMDDFHKPALDQIGFQDLITDQMAWWETGVGSVLTDGITFKSAGKQPAWVNYMTSVNKTYGNFAVQDNEMFMTLNRRYEASEDRRSIADLTTYIDPVKFNHIFADTSLDAQNFWIQIAVDITARRKMSAKLMPNL